MREAREATEVTAVRLQSCYRFTPRLEQDERRTEEATMERIEHWSKRVLDTRSLGQAQMVDSRLTGANTDG